jgi:hypothetical protein
MCLGQCSTTTESTSLGACLSPSDYPREDMAREYGEGAHQLMQAIEYDLWHNNFDAISYVEYNGQRTAIDGFAFSFSAVACCSIGQAIPANYGNPQPHDGRATSLGKCDNVEEGMVATTDVDAAGNSYMLVGDAASWTAGRDACQAAGGQLANIQSPEEEKKITDLMEAAGTKTAWLCNEIVSTTAGYKNWGDDVAISTASAYYEPVDMPEVPLIGSYNFPDPDEDCRPNPVEECDCADEEGDSSCYSRHMRNDLPGDGTGDQSEDERGCFCLECPTGTRVRRDRIEYAMVTDPCRPEPCADTDYCAVTAQVYDGAYCGQLRMRYQAETGTNKHDWGAEECDEALPYVCNMSPTQKFVDHCFIPLSRRSHAQGRGLGPGLLAVALALYLTGHAL